MKGDLFPAMAAAGWNVHYTLALGAQRTVRKVFKRRHDYIQKHPSLMVELERRIDGKGRYSAY